MGRLPRLLHDPEESIVRGGKKKRYFVKNQHEVGSAPAGLEENNKKNAGVVAVTWPRIMKNRLRIYSKAGHLRLLREKVGGNRGELGENCIDRAHC